MLKLFVAIVANKQKPIELTPPKYWKSQSKRNIFVSFGCCARYIFCLADSMTHVNATHIVMFPVYLAIDMDKQTYNFPLSVYWHVLFFLRFGVCVRLEESIYSANENPKAKRSSLLLASKQDKRRPRKIRDNSYFVESIELWVWECICSVVKRKHLTEIAEIKLLFAISQVLHIQRNISGSFVC